MKYRNKKNKHIYVMLYQAVDCTNARDGTLVVVYRHESNQNQIFVRDADEFYEKFEPVT